MCVLVNVFFGKSVANQMNVPTRVYLLLKSAKVTKTRSADLTQRYFRSYAY